MVTLRRVCVFCGSSPGVRPVYAEAAQAVGRALANEGIGLVYGGGSVGLMGAIADAALAGGGEVIGVIPEPVTTREVTHFGLSELHVVGSMHDRKALMYDLADGFIALPGGFGTLDELFESTTWSQLGLHVKPTGLLDAGGFFKGLVDFLDHITAEGFVSQVHRQLLVVEDDPGVLLGRLREFEPPPLPSWLRPGER